MAFQVNLLSPKGRLSRRSFWICVLTIFAVKLAILIAIVERPEWKSSLHSDFLLLFVAACLGKRMHDFGWSAKWAWFAVVFFCFVLPIAAMMLQPPPTGTTSVLKIFPWWLGLASSLPLMLIVTFVGLKKGDPAPNEYGEVPA